MEEFVADAMKDLPKEKRNEIQKSLDKLKTENSMLTSERGWKDPVTAVGKIIEYLANFITGSAVVARTKDLRNAMHLEEMEFLRSTGNFQRLAETNLDFEVIRDAAIAEVRAAQTAGRLTAQQAELELAELRQVRTIHRFDAEVSAATEEALVDAGRSIGEARKAVEEGETILRQRAARTGRAWRGFGKGAAAAAVVAGLIEAALRLHEETERQAAEAKAGTELELAISVLATSRLYATVAQKNVERLTDYPSSLEKLAQAVADNKPADITLRLDDFEKVLVAEIEPRPVYDQLYKRDNDNHKKTEEDPSYEDMVERHRRIVEQLKARG